MEGDLRASHPNAESPEREPALRSGPRALLAAALLAGGTGAGQEPRHDRCGSSEYRQFDFWAGNWDVFEVSNRDTVVARARVERILEGCALREIYDGRNGLSGQSLSSFDGGRKLWHQSWVTNRGQLLVIEGGMKGNRMVLQGPYPPGSSTLLRGVWSRMGSDVRETAETSEDAGKTWHPLFDLVFRKAAHR